MVHPMLEFAREVIRAHVTGDPLPDDGPPEARGAAQGCFVSLKIKGRLRGCIGTILPVHETLAEEIASNAISSATNDPRFSPLNASELSHIQISLDLLDIPESIESIAQLDPKRYGVIVRGDHGTGVLLPDLSGVDSAEMQVKICREKAGLTPDEPVELERFTVSRIGE